MLRDNIIRSSASASIQWQGTWGDGTSYVINDLVENNGSSYIAITNHVSTINDEPGVGANWETYWDLFVAGGSDGTDGVDGLDGESFIWRGVWSIDTTSYLINDVVYNNGSSYIATDDHSPSLDTEPGDGTSWTTVWNIMTLAGQDGTAGATGQDGTDGTDGQDGVFTRCDQLILEMEMEFKTSYLCFYKELTYSVSKQLTDIDIWTDTTANVLLFHKDLTYNSKKQLIQTDLTRTSDSAILTSVFTYNSQKQLISIERSGYCSCSSSSSSVSSSSSSSSLSVSIEIDSTCFIALNDDFTGTNGDAFNSQRWEAPITNHSTVDFGAEILDNAGRLFLTGVADPGSDSCEVKTRFKLTGDFDIEIDFKNLSHLNHNAAGLQFGLTFDDGYYFFVKPQYYAASNSFLTRFYDGVIDDQAFGRTNSYGQLKLTRVGSTCSIYTVDGAPTSWTFRKSATLTTSHALMSLLLYDFQDDAEIRCDVDNLIITSYDGVICPTSSSSSSISSSSSSSSSST